MWMAVSFVLPVRKAMEDGVSILKFRMIKERTWKMVGPVEAEMSVPTALRKANAANVDDQEGGEA